MKINVSARPRKNAFLGKTQYMMAVAANYSSIGASEVVDELSQKIQMPKEQIENALMSLRLVVQSHVVNGHSVEVPGLGFLRFGMRSSAVTTPQEVTTKLIKAVRLNLFPCKEIKAALAATEIAITCYDENGEVVKRGHAGNVPVEDGSEEEANSQQGNDNTGGSGTQTGTGSNGSHQGSGSGTGIPIDPGPGGDDPDL